jgi:hypothetical protein
MRRVLTGVVCVGKTSPVKQREQQQEHGEPAKKELSATIHRHAKRGAFNIVMQDECLGAVTALDIHYLTRVQACQRGRLARKEIAETYCQLLLVKPELHVRRVASYSCSVNFLPVRWPKLNGLFRYAEQFESSMEGWLQDTIADETSSLAREKDRKKAARTLHVRGVVAGANAEADVAELFSKFGVVTQVGSTHSNTPGRVPHWSASVHTAI